MSAVRHTPLRPSWACSACGAPWPCAPRRAAFLADYPGRRHFLRAVLAMLMYDAAEDMQVSAGDLHERFIGWSLHR